MVASRIRVIPMDVGMVFGDSSTCAKRISGSRW